MQMAVALRDGIPFADLASEFRMMETIWRDPATPNVAQAMDAAVKGVQAGIYDIEQGQEAVGLSPVQRREIAERAASGQASAATADATAKLALAQNLMDTQGLSQPAAYAAAGLLQAAGVIAADQKQP